MFVYNIIVDFVDITIMGTFSHEGWDDYNMEAICAKDHTIE